MTYYILYLPKWKLGSTIKYLLWNTTRMQLVSACKKTHFRISERLNVSCSSVSLLVCLAPKCKKNDFLKKLSNLELRCLLTTHRKLCNWAFQRTRYWIPKIQDGWDLPSWKSTWRPFFWRGWSDLDKISETGAEWHVDCGDVWKWKPDLEF